ncbi:MAG TPA: energy transducer TonB [Thermoanaerobaculia bacterium]|jgi:protein TonB|nr:energy transducer TonB [Thermoanaerobaculia bacterium]
MGDDLRPGRAGRGGVTPEERATRLPPLLVMLAAAALAVLLVCGTGFAILLLRGSHRGGAQEVVGAALPPGWQPGSGVGVGQPPPEPPAGAARPVGTVPPPPEAAEPPPAEGPPSDELEPDAQATPPYGEQPPAPPPAGDPDFQPPRLLYLPTPEYPRFAQRMGREGVVELQVRVGADGSVLAADPVGERLGMGFEAEARRAAFGARFAPARRDGVPVESETNIAIRFRLR